MHDPQQLTGQDIAASLPELADLISGRLAAWADYGYENPPAPGHASIPPLGQRSAGAIRNGYQAIEDIDEMIRQLHVLRRQLERELREDSDIRAVRVDAMLAEHAARRAGGAR